MMLDWAGDFAVDDDVALARPDDVDLAPDPRPLFAPEFAPPPSSRSSEWAVAAAGGAWRSGLADTDGPGTRNDPPLDWASDAERALAARIARAAATFDDELTLEREAGFARGSLEPAPWSLPLTSQSRAIGAVAAAAALLMSLLLMAELVAPTLS